ncbi:MAG: cyclic nucleotide-binding domain-containing protein [Gammaproteobacteria bacterium]
MSNSAIRIDPGLTREMELFRELGEEDAASLAAIASLREVAGKTDLFSQGDAADSLYILVEGRISLAIQVPGRAHAESVVSTVSTGELLGWSALLPDRVWQVSAHVIKPSRLIDIPGAELRQLCERNCGLGYKIATRMLAVVGQRLTESRVQFLDIFGQTSE